MKSVIISFLFPFVAFSVNLDESGCFTRNQILKMQSSPNEKSQEFLFKENWYRTDGVRKMVDIFGYDLKYQQDYWVNRYYSADNISIFTANFKSNILIFQTNRSCFNQLLSEFPEVKLISNDANGILRRGLVGTVFVEFKEVPSNDGYNSFLVSVYNPTFVKPELDALKKKEADIRKAKLERERKISTLISQGDSLFTAKAYESAKLKYQAVLAIESNDEITEKIYSCERFICQEKVNVGNRYMEEENYQKAIDHFNKIKDCADKYNDGVDDFDVDSKIEKCKFGLCNLDIKAGDALFASGKFSQAIERFQDAKKCLSAFSNTFASSQVETKIFQARKSILMLELAIGDSLYVLEQYDAALKKYNAARSIGVEKDLIEQKIKQVQEASLKKQLNGLNEEGIRQLGAKNYSEALSTFKKIQTLSPYNTEVSQKIKSIEETLRLIDLRKTTILSYKDAEKASFISLQSKLIDFGKSKLNASNSGKLLLEVNVKFDTSGKNLSSLNGSEGMKSDEERELNSYVKNELIAPQNAGFFFAAKENLNLNLDWKTAYLKEKTRKNAYFTYSDYAEINTFIQNHSDIKHAKYSFEKKTVKVESNNLGIKNITVDQFYLTKCKTPGPGNAFLSLLTPGIGTLKVTQGQKGKGRMILFLLSSATAYYSNLLYKDYEAKYKTATNPTDYDTYYSKANDAYQIYTGALGFSASIYVYDFFWVISKGKSNRRNARSLNASLKEGKLLINPIDPLK
jgi:tetratricopeptide (TPR) repeat protein